MKNIAIIGGGAAGMTCAVALARGGMNVILLERDERLGRKLSATGNGQGNVTNVFMGAEHYFSDDREKVKNALSCFSERDTVRFLEGMGGIFLADNRGRVYPCGRQASAVTDLFRRELEKLRVDVRLSTRVLSVTRQHGQFCIQAQNERFLADSVVLAAGGCAAPNFGTDGSAYALAKGFGHTVTDCKPALVQLKTRPEEVRGLKGIRVDGTLRLRRGQRTVYECRGDVLFTESGLSGDAVFRASSYAQAKDQIEIDLLPDVPHERLAEILHKNAGEGCLLCVVNNGLGRVLYKRADGDEQILVRLLKAFPCTVTGTLGFAYAQVTRGGIPLSEVDDSFMSLKQRGLHFAGEMLNVDGECGGYNLQWAFTSAHVVAEGILC